MSEQAERLFTERLARYQAAIALEMPDRVPIASGTNYFAEVYAGFTNQEVLYDPAKQLEADRRFVQDFPEIDTLRNVRLWAPLHDAIGFNVYRIPGRDLPPRAQFQFVEGERMMADEYDLLINNPAEFMFERVLPRTLNELKSRGSMRSYIAFLKGGMGYMMQAAASRNRAMVMQNELGMPQPTQGLMLAPFDMLADGLRGLTGIMMDVRRQPHKVVEACEAMIPDMVNATLALADPLRRWPIFMPLHRGCFPFLSPKQFDELYWPTLKKAMLMLIDAGYTIRAYLEGDWGPNWHHIRELPKGKVLCDIDVQGDIFRAKQEIGDCQCLAGGVPDSMLILGTPDDVRQRVRLLCETVGKDGGWIVNGGCNIPYDTKPENFRAMIDATLEYGRYSDSTKYQVHMSATPPEGYQPPPSRVITPWEVKLEELGGVMGDEQLIKQHWVTLERMAYNWLWTWTW